MIPSGGNKFKPFIKLPNKGYDKSGEISVGDKVLIKNEFIQPRNAKIKSYILGIVELTNGEERTLGLPLQGYLEIAKYYGEDTKDWIGKFLEYQGLKKGSSVTGESFTIHTWQPEDVPLVFDEYPGDGGEDKINEKI